MVVFSLMFVAAAISLYRLGFGDASLVYANIVNLIARIVFAVGFAKSFFEGKEGGKGLVSVRRALPSFGLVGLSFVCWVVVAVDGKRRDVERVVSVEGRRSLLSGDVVQHVGIGSALAVVWLSYWWMSSGRKRNLRPRA
jgi:oligosaccharide translocation protein RFT1